jgi:hypothetical protein
MLSLLIINKLYRKGSEWRFFLAVQRSLAYCICQRAAYPFQQSSVIISMHIRCIDLNYLPAYFQIGEAALRDDVAVVFGKIEIAVVDMPIGRVRSRQETFEQDIAIGAALNLQRLKVMHLLQSEKFCCSKFRIVETAFDHQRLTSSQERGGKMVEQIETGWPDHGRATIRGAIQPVKERLRHAISMQDWQAQIAGETASQHGLARSRRTIDNDKQRVHIYLFTLTRTTYNRACDQADQRG